MGLAFQNSDCSLN